MKRIFKILAIVVALLIVVVLALPFLIDANTFRPKLETELTVALGRPVKVGNLTLSLFSGGVSADDISIADDPQFSKSAFVQAKSLSVGVELIPLIFSKTLNITELTLKQPEISLVKSENGEKWNFSSLGGNNTSATKPATPSSSGNPNLSVAKLTVSDGKLESSKTQVITISSPPVPAKTVTLSGLITDTLGAKLEGVKVEVVGGSSGANTDVKGKVSLSSVGVDVPVTLFCHKFIMFLLPTINAICELQFFIFCDPLDTFLDILDIRIIKEK